MRLFTTRKSIESGDERFGTLKVFSPPQRMEEMDHRLIFQHIPKTAGSTLIPLVTGQFERSDVFLCGSSDGVLNDFFDLDQNRRDRLALLFGHVDFGIHAAFNGGSKYIAFLRDPVERALSHYYFIKTNSGHRYHRKAREIGIKEFIQKGIRPRMNNCMTRMLSGKNPGYGQCHAGMIDLALSNIERHYIFLGELTRFSESVDRLVKKMGWKTVSLKRKNTNKRRPSLSSLSESEIDAIRRYNELDIRLYDIIREKHFQ